MSASPSSNKGLCFKLDRLLTVEELAAKLRVSLKTVRSWIYLRKIPFTKIEHRIYFSLDVIEEMLSRNAVAAIRSGSLADSKPTGQGGAQTQETNT